MEESATLDTWYREGKIKQEGEEEEMSSGREFKGHGETKVNQKISSFHLHKNVPLLKKKKSFKIRNLVHNRNALNLLNIAGPKEDRYLKQKTHVYLYKTILKRRKKMIIKLVQLKKIIIGKTKQNIKHCKTIMSTLMLI